MVDIVMGHWSSLECWWNSDNQETKALALSLVTKAIIIDQKVSITFHVVLFLDASQVHRDTENKWERVINQILLINETNICNNLL